MGAVKATGFFGAWLSLVERFVRDEEVARSNRVAPISLLSSRVLVEDCSQTLIPPRAACFV